MNSKSAGQMLYEALHESVVAEFGLPAETFEPWDQVRESQRMRLEAAAAAALTEQLREVRADRDQLKKRMLDLASAWEDEAADDLARIRPAPGGSTRAGVLNQCAGQICKGLDV